MHSNKIIIISHKKKDINIVYIRVSRQLYSCAWGWYNKLGNTSVLQIGREKCGNNYAFPHIWGVVVKKLSYWYALGPTGAAQWGQNFGYLALKNISTIFELSNYLKTFFLGIFSYKNQADMSNFVLTTLYIFYKIFIFFCKIYLVFSSVICEYLG